MGQLINTDILNTTISDDTEIFKIYTHKLNDYNEMYNANNQLKNINNQEYNKIKKFNENINNKLYVQKQNYLLKEASVYQYEMRNNIILITVIVISLLFYIVAYYINGYLSNKKLFFITSSIMLIYLFIVWIIIKFVSWRRINSWNQYYF